MTLPTDPFVDNSNPVGGGVGPPANASFFNSVVSRLTTADNDIVSVKSRLFDAEARLNGAAVDFAVVTAYGAVSDPTGVIDSTAAFTAAYATGKTVLVPSGTFNVTALNSTNRSLTVGYGEVSQIRYSGTGTMCSLTNAQRTRFADLKFVVTDPAGTLFMLSNSFRCSWQRCVFQGQHTDAGDAYSTVTGHVGVNITENAGDSIFYDCDWLNLGVGIRTDAIQNGVIGGKFGNCHVGVYGYGGGGISISGYTVFVSLVAAGGPAANTHIKIDGAGGQWWIADTWFEGTLVAVQVGNSTSGPAQFGMTNCKVAATTTCIDMQFCRNPIIMNVSMTGDSGNTATPNPITVNSTNAPEGLLFADSIVSGKQINPSTFPIGWTVHTRSSNSAAFRVPNSLEFAYGGAVNMARSDGTLVTTLQQTGGPRLAIRGSGYGVAGSVRFFDTAGNILLDVDSVALGVNQLAIASAPAGSPPELAARGTDANVDLMLRGKGTGSVRLANGALRLNNVAAAPAAPTGGGILYVEAGALKYRGSSGSVTTVAPA